MKKVRESRGWNQQQLAEQLDAAASWVSQVEAGTVKPSPERLAVMEVLLGPSVARADPGSATEGVDPETIAFPLLWRARADLLGQLAQSSSSKPQRARLNRLSRGLVEAAAEHPRAQPFVRGGGLQSLAELAVLAPEWMRRQVLIEIALMKLDAPYETNFDKGKRLELLDLVVDDLNLPASAHKRLQEAVDSFPRSRPWWQHLQPVGGPFGVVQAELADDDRGLRFVLADDPVGWLGFDYAAGSWLVRWCDDDANEQANSGEPLRGGYRFAPWGAVGVLAPRAGMTAGATVAGAAALGPVLGAALGAAAVGFATRSLIKKGAGQARREPSSAGSTSAAAVLTSTMCEAFGRHWVRVEATKLAALYRTFPDLTKGDADAHLPSSTTASKHLLASVEVTGKRWEEEAEASGTKSHDKNERLRELADIADTLQAAADMLAR